MGREKEEGEETEIENKEKRKHVRNIKKKIEGRTLFCMRSPSQGHWDFLGRVSRVPAQKYISP